MKVARLVGMITVVLIAVTVVPMYDTQHATQLIKDEVKAMRSLIPMRNPANKAILVRVGKHLCRKAKPKKLGKKILKLNHITPDLF